MKICTISLFPLGFTTCRFRSCITVIGTEFEVIRCTLKVSSLMKKLITGVHPIKLQGFKVKLMNVSSTAIRLDIMLLECIALSL